MPQYIPPHPHANPVRPTFFLQAQRFFLTFLGSFSSSTSSTAATGEASTADWATAPSTTSASALTSSTMGAGSSTLTFRFEREAAVLATSSLASDELASFFRKSL